MKSSKYLLVLAAAIVRGSTAGSAPSAAEGKARPYLRVVSSRKIQSARPEVSRYLDARHGRIYLVQPASGASYRFTLLRRQDLGHLQTTDGVQP